MSIPCESVQQLSGGLIHSSLRLRENQERERQLTDVEQPASGPASGRAKSSRVAKHGGGLHGATGIKLYEQGQLSEAVEVLDHLVQRGSYVQNFSFYGLLKRCIAEKDLVLGSRVHVLAVKSGYESSAFLANHLICMYASHRRLEEAAKVFSKVPSPSRQMWSSLILAYARHGQPAEAIRLYRKMRGSSLKPDSRIFVAALKACATAKDLSSGREVHSDIMRSAVEDDVFVGNSLVNMYAKCGALDDARGVFDKLPTRDVVTWNAMIAGYSQSGLGQEALGLYASMQQHGMNPTDPVTFVCLLKACDSSKDLHQGRMLHTHIQERGLEADVLVGNCLLTMYAKCGSLADARKVFDNMPTKNIVTWTAMIGGYAQHGAGHESLALYASMQQEGITPANRVTFVCLLQACASAQSVHEGKQLHAQIQERGMEADVVIGTCLVDMYSKCGSMDDARRVFDSLSGRNMVTWTAMIVGYAQRGLSHEALGLFRSMEQEGITPADPVTFACLLQACASIGALHQGKQLHAHIQEKGLEADLVVGTCLVDMYAKCGSMQDACMVFDSMSTKDVVTWTAMLAGYAQQGFGEEALSLYSRMEQEDGINLADTVTFVCLLQACGSVAGLEKGKEIHAQVFQLGLQSTELFVSNALIDMYSKCGSMVDAQQVFDALSLRDIVTWSALIAGYARQGQNELVFELFGRMEQEGVHPNAVTFLSLLTACSHAGLVEEGKKYFETMTSYGITPTIEHYSCMVDLLGRAGHLGEAMELVKSMPFQATSEIWRCLLGACRKWRDTQLGKQAFECAVKLDRNDPAAYILMSNIYGGSDMQQEAKDIQAMRVKAQAWKKPGHSCWTDSAGVVHTFVVGDTEHHEGTCIHANLEVFFVKLKEDGYVPQLDPILQDMLDLQNKAVQ